MVYGKKYSHMVLILIVSFLWAYLEGKREAQYFHYKWLNPNPTPIKDEHFEFTLQRSLYVISSYLISTLIFNWWIGIITFITISMSFSFFHNGSYYLNRNKLNKDIYKLKWKDSSQTTTAKISFNYKNRLILFIISFILTILFDIIILIYKL